MSLWNDVELHSLKNTMERRRTFSILVRPFFFKVIGLFSNEISCNEGVCI